MHSYGQSEAVVGRLARVRVRAREPVRGLVAVAVAVAVAHLEFWPPRLEPAVEG
jgi:hypothetical protein